MFGKVIDSASMTTVRKIEKTAVSGAQSKPKVPIVISECGEL